MVKVSLVGAYGFWNYGDDLLAWIFSEKIREWLPNAQILVSAPDNGSNYIKKITKAKWVSPITSPKYWLKQGENKTRDSDYVVFGGGGILYDYPHLTKYKSIDPRRSSALFYLTSLRSYSKKGLVIAHGIGIGPLKSKYSFLLTNHFLSKIDLLTVRDNESYFYTKNHELEVKVIPDSSYILAKNVNKELEVLPKIGVVVRKWKGSSIFNNESELKSFFNKLEKETGYEIVPISLRTGEFEYVGGRKIYEWNPETTSPNEFANQLGGFSVLISMRLHAMNVAACYGVPSIPIGIDPKIINSAKSLGLENYLCSIDVKENELTEKVINLLRNKEIRKELKKITRQYSNEVEDSFNRVKFEVLNNENNN